MPALILRHASASIPSIEPDSERPPSVMTSRPPPGMWNMHHQVRGAVPSRESRVVDPSGKSTRQSSSKADPTAPSYVTTSPGGAVAWPARRHVVSWSDSTRARNQHKTKVLLWMDTAGFEGHDSSSTSSCISARGRGMVLQPWAGLG